MYAITIPTFNLLYILSR